MKWSYAAVAALVCVSGYILLSQPRPAGNVETRLARHRNLGKAFYENPTTQNEALAEFRAALALAPNSIREQLNVALALLRAGKTPEGVAELEKVQKKDPSIPHTWFNLGVQYKKLGETEKSIAQFERMVQLVPNEPISAYNLGSLYRQAGRTEEAERFLKQAATLDANLAAPHFQLFNLYRTTNRLDDGKRELAAFQMLKKAQEGSATPEDVDWSAYSEIYDIAQDSTPLRDVKLSFQTGVGKRVFRTVPQADFDNDGLLDSLALTPQGVLLRRRTKSGYSPIPLPNFTQVPATAVWLDVDHDYDLDLILLGKNPSLLRNQGAAGFIDRTADFPFVQGVATGAIALRVLPDTKGLDLVVSYRDRDSVLYRDLLGGKYAAEPIPLPRNASKLAAFDHGNDGDFDIAFIERDTAALLLNDAAGRFTLSSFRVPARSFALADLDHRGILGLIAGNKVFAQNDSGFTSRAEIAGLPGICDEQEAISLNADALPDLACLSGNVVTVAANTTKTPFKWARIKLTGVRNGKLAIHSEVEIKAGPRYQKRAYLGEPVTVGLGDHVEADTIRITWPNGLIQNETKQLAGKTLAYVEAQRLSGSCPIIWTWNGHGFEYITDVLGVAPLGASSGDGKYFATDHDEYIWIPGESLVPRDGALEVRITEELSEVAYLDHVRLIAVDHPADTSIYTNEKFKAPPFPEFRLFGVTQRIAPRTATGPDGRDIRGALNSKDRSYAEGFRRTMSGVADTHALTLDFGNVAADGKAFLVLSGWVDWADGSTFIGISQEGKGGLAPPSLQMKDTQGRWRTVIEDMGMPAGKPKTIAVDLSGKWLSSSREVRIVTNLCIYWDEIFLSEGSGASEVKLTSAEARDATLRFRGFSPSTIHPERRQPESFAYDGATPVSLWNPTPGNYTRYGDVKPLTRAIDDRMIVMGSGDEVRMTFDPASLPPLRSGWRRDYLLLVDGWAKDRDANTAHSQTTTPLPFHAMSQFPYPASERYPETSENIEYRREYNTRPALRLIRPLRP